MITGDAELAEVYSRYLELRNPVGRLFPVGFQAINGMVNRIRRAAKLDRSVTPRVLRDTYTMMRVLEGATEDELIRDLGHADEYRNRQSLQRFLMFSPKVELG